MSSSEAEFIASIGGDTEQLKKYREFQASLSDPWITLWRSWGVLGRDVSGTCYCGLIRPDQIEHAVSHPGWEVRIDSNNPGFSQSYREGSTQTTYQPVGSDGTEPIVHVRLGEGRFPRDFILSTELVLLFNLHRGGDGAWYWIDESGDDHLVLVLEPGLIRAQRWLIRRYQAARQLALELTIDSDVWSGSLKDLGAADAEFLSETTCLVYYRSQLSPGDVWFSRLFGKHVIAPPPVEDCGLWPYEPPPKYESFVIDIDDLGRPVEFSSNPDGLANYFGANPGAPQYVTPVVFKREVLESTIDHHTSTRLRTDTSDAKGIGEFGLTTMTPK